MGISGQFWAEGARKQTAHFSWNPKRPRQALIAQTVALWMLLTVSLVGYPSSSASAAQLVMFESPVCEYCELWHEEIGPIYPKTEEGKRAPLRPVFLQRRKPEDLKFVKGVTYTPTFVLVDEGREVGRIVGYMGEDFFWAYLELLIEKLPEENNTLPDR